MKMKLLFLILAAVFFSGVVKAQESESEENSPVSIPENIRQEIVRRILVFKFKPAKRPKVINLAAAGVDSAALPQIANVEFRLLSDEALEDIDQDVYFFTALGLENKIYSIGFAYGDPRCDYTGDHWNFRITNDRLRLWYAGAMGGGCGGGGRGFKFPGALNTYPNELEGYKFFDRGKLTGLKLMISTKEDVINVFGSDCARDCDYDEKWKVNFDYFGSISKEKTVGDKKVMYVPKKELVGKIYSITLISKQPLPFSNVVFPRQFNRLDGFSVGHGFDPKGGFTAAGTSYQTYVDRYGLEYTIYESGYTVGIVEKENRRKGELMAIQYTIPDEIEKTTFVEGQ